MSNPAENIKPGMVIAERYRVVRQLGRGGMGSVFLVEHVHTDEQLALKILHAAVISDSIALERFRREARTPARINSDHVVRVTDADVATELGGAPFLVMEYLRGEDLDQRLDRVGPLPSLEVVLYLRQAARALDKAHALGIIHRDLKPENLFLTTREDSTPCIKILDFGIAKLTGEASRELVRAAATTTGQIFGTPLFMSPEQAKGESSKICPQTDVWALGLIAHRLLTGQDIWTAETITHLIAQIAYEPMPIPSEHGAPFGHEYDAWFAICCARDVTKRYATAGEAVTALARTFGLTEITTSPGSGDRITGRFVIDVPKTNSGMHAANTLSASQLNLLGEPPPTEPAPKVFPTPSGRASHPSHPSHASHASHPPTPEETQRKSSAGPLTLTGMKLGTAPKKNSAARIIAPLALACLFVGGGVFWYWRQSATTNGTAASGNGLDVRPAVSPLSTDTKQPTDTAPAGVATGQGADVADAGAHDASGSTTGNTMGGSMPGATHSAGSTGPLLPFKTQRNNKPYDPLGGRH